MKNTQTCPKCGSTDIIRAHGKGRSMTGAVGNAIAAGLVGHVYVTRFLCGGCGYSEEWVESPEDVQRLREAYPAEH